MSVTDREIYEAMERGHNKFVHKSGKAYWLDPAQRDALKPFGSNALLIGYPEKPHPRKRGRKWSWLAPKNLSLPEEEASK